MKSSTVIGIIVLLVVAGAGWYYFSPKMAPQMQNPVVREPSSPGMAGINGSQNQGNMGQSNTGQVQQPMEDGAEGSIIGSNIALGTDANATLGTYLIAYNGMTVYTYAKDTGSTSTCYGQCAQNWPPYLVGAEDNVQQLKAGVNGKVDTTIRTDGSIQVTYNGHPLYFYIQDKTSGDVKGQGVGGVWYVVKP